MLDQTAPFREVLQKLRMPFTEKGNRLELRCPFHDDRTPSSGVYKSTGRFFCFTCDLSLNAGGFLARATGEGEDKATKLLEDKYGPLELPKDKQKQQRLNKERTKAEIRLRDLRAKGISRTGYGKAAELFDRLVFLYQGEAMDADQFDDYLSQWYNTDIAEMETIDVTNPNKGGAAGADFDGRVSKRSSNLSRDGEEGVRESLGQEHPDDTDGLAEDSNPGSDLLTFD